MYLNFKTMDHFVSLVVKNKDMLGVMWRVIQNLTGIRSVNCDSTISSLELATNGLL